MEKAFYNQLKSIDSGRLYWEIKDFLRRKTYRDESTVYITGILFGSYLMKVNSMNNQEELLDFVNMDIKSDVLRKQLRAIYSDDYCFKLAKGIAEKESIEMISSAIVFGSSQALSSSHGLNISYLVTPYSILNLAIELLNLNSDDVVYDATSGVSNFLIEAAMESGSNQLYGTELNREAILLSKIKEFVLDLDLDIDLRDTLEKMPKNMQPTKVFSDSPFGMKARSMKHSIEKNEPLKDYLSGTKIVSGDWVFATSAMLAQKLGGKSVVSMVSGSLYNEADKGIRKKLIEDGKIEAIIALPPKLYLNTAIPVNFLILSENNKTIRMINATNQFTELSRNQNHLSEENMNEILKAYTVGSKFSKDVSIEMLEKEDYVLSPVRYMGDLLDEDDGTPLSEVSLDIIRGAMITKKELDELTSDQGNYKYIQIKDIENGMVSKDLPMLESIDQKYEKSIVQNGDILVSKTAPFKFAIAEVDPHDKVIATGNLYIIRPDQSKIEPVYLGMYLQSKEGETQLKRYVTGTAIQTISISALNKIIIPEKDINTQKQLVKEYEAFQEDLILLDQQKRLILKKQKELLEEAF